MARLYHSRGVCAINVNSRKFKKMIAYAKMFFYLLILSITVFLYLSLKNNTLIDYEILKTDHTKDLVNVVMRLESDVKYDVIIDKGKSDHMKYILQWTSPKTSPFVYMGQGQQNFIDKNCPYTNCFVTSDRSFFEDITRFDVIAFNSAEVFKMSANNLPKRRSPRQKFVLASLESSDYYPVCSNRFDGYFNWTWTYKLDSEGKWGYVVVRDSNNKVIGPQKEMHWIKHDDMKPVSEELKEKLKSKSKAVAWFVSNCKSRSSREVTATYLRKQLEKHNLTLDIYGACGPFKCSRGDNEYKCNKKLERDYFFYLSFENSFSDDYVTEKLVLPLQYNTVPIVFGGANYTRFMPDGMYINAKNYSIDKLALKIYELIQNPDKYYEYFKWKNHYSYHRRAQSVETDDYCHFCTMLNNATLVQSFSVYQDFRKWWDPPGRC